MRARPSLALIVVLTVSASTACAPGEGTPGLLVDGGWKGTYECGADSKKLSAIFDEDEDGDVRGEAFLDYQVVFFGTPILLTGRAVVDDASRNEDTYEGHLDVLDNSQGLSDFDFDLDLDSDGETLEGDLVIRNGDGDVTETCSAQLDKVDVDN